MTISTEWRALQQEAHLAAEQTAAGVTALGRANHTQTGLYSQAFFGLSIGLERLGKLIVIADHAVNNLGTFPTNNDLKRIGHDLLSLLDSCAAIGGAVGPERAYATRPADVIHQGIEVTLSEFAIKSRYYNLDYIAGRASSTMDPIANWWKYVAEPICERHYSAAQRRKDAARAAVMAELLGAHSAVLHRTEDGGEMGDVGAFFTRAGSTLVVQRYGRLYTLQIVRWLTSLLLELSHAGGYQKRIEPLLGLNEPFTIFFNDNRYLRDRRTWSIYRP